MVAVGQPFSLLLPLHADPCGFGAVVDHALLEPRVLQRLLGRDALFGVVDENLFEKVQELLVEHRRWRNDFLKSDVSV